MALLDYEGFDRETNLALSNWWDFGIGSGSVSADGTGVLGYGRYADGTAGNGRNLAANHQTFWFQAHLRINTPHGGDWTYKFNDSGAQQFWVGFEADLRVKYVLPSGVVTMAGPVMALNAWYWIQIRIHIANSGGSIQFWSNGVLQHTYTGDTQITANAWVNQWALHNGGATFHDNCMLYSETGNAPNARTGECRVYSFLATSDVSVAMTPSAGSNYQCVDEQPNDGDTTYVSTPVPATDIYGYSGTITPGSTVYAVGVEYVARKDDGGTNIVNPVLQVGGVTYDGPTVGLTTSYQRQNHFWDLNPATGLPWTVSAANAVNAGIERDT